MGGEEFVLVITRTQAAEVMQLANAALCSGGCLSYPHVRSQSGFVRSAWGGGADAKLRRGCIGFIGGGGSLFVSGEKQGRNQAVLCANV